MEKEKYIKLTYNGGAITELKHEDYLKNIHYWSRVTAKKETFYKTN
jgi:hypothetical protein